MFLRVDCRVALVAASLVSLRALPVLACPDLSGTFDCPAVGKDPPMTLIVKTKATVDDGATYDFTYRIMGKDLPLKVEVPPKAARRGGESSSCDGLNYLHKEPNEPGEGTRSFINAQGNFERDKDGKSLVVCVRKQG